MKTQINTGAHFFTCAKSFNNNGRKMGHAVIA